MEDGFKTLFPVVYDFIRQVNKDGWEHSNLIRKLQRAESDLVIGQVAESIRRHHPEMFFMTLHDAIYSTEEKMPRIRSAFERAFAYNGYKMSLGND